MRMSFSGEKSNNMHFPNVFGWLHMVVRRIRKVKLGKIIWNTEWWDGNHNVESP